MAGFGRLAELVGSARLVGLMNSLEIGAEYWVKNSSIENETKRQVAAFGLGSSRDWPEDQCGTWRSVGSP